ncbi:hypothetical protein [Paenarthrobacter sp. NPDC090522]|uniref:hypothetical protein n=1 Tax=Paenarthrobacter sp. NPDC090522 TaxID=3364383 RepID=UPI00381F3C7F
MTDQTWFIDLDLKLEAPVSDSQLDDLIDAVTPLHGAISAGDEPKLGLALSVEAIDAWHASNLARNFVELDLGPIMPKAELSSIRILDYGTRTAENEEPTFPPMMAIPDIGDLLGVTRQQAHRLTKREDFPTPALEPRTGPLWIRAAVESWKEHTKRQAGRPSKTTTEGIRTENADTTASPEVWAVITNADTTHTVKVVKDPSSSTKVLKDPNSGTWKAKAKTRTIRG